MEDNDNSRVKRQRPYDPAVKPGLGLNDFRRICVNGFGEGHNSFAHSMVWYKDHIYVGTTRANFQMVKIQATFKKIPVYMWPVEGPDEADELYKLDRRAQIWRYDPRKDDWEEVFRSPWIDSIRGDGMQVAREIGLRSMVIYQGDSDTEPSLYTATFASSRSPGALLLRTVDGNTFDPVTPYGIIEGLPVTATRVLVPFKGKLYTSPTGTRGHDVKFVINVSGNPVIYECTDPTSAKWTAVSEPGFGDLKNQGVFMVCPFNNQLYAGTFNLEGYEVWRSDCEGAPPYKWVKVIDKGAHRGPLNQCVASMKEFKGALYVGGGIQNGGCDHVNNIGPAGSELIRIHPDDSWDILVGDPRDTPEGKKHPMSGFVSGFGNLFNGYFWEMEVHDDWLYLGTMDSTIWVQWLRMDAYSEQASTLVKKVGVENILENEAGCDLWRSADGENWVPVTRIGFDNRYNLGIRKLVSTPHGLFVAVANVFGPRVAVEENGEWKYTDNPRGGLEIWLGQKQESPADSEG